MAASIAAYVNLCSATKRLLNSDESKIYAAFIRDKVKDHGVQSHVVGLEALCSSGTEHQRDQTVFHIVDDVVTSGSTLRETIKVLEKQGIKRSQILSCIVVFDRSQGLNSVAGVRIRPLLKVAAFDSPREERLSYQME